jgi:hypothetical protein
MSSYSSFHSMVPPPPLRSGSVIIPTASIILANTIPPYLYTFPDYDLAAANAKITGIDNSVILNAFNNTMNSVITAYEERDPPPQIEDTDANEKNILLKWSPDAIELATKIQESKTHDYLVRTQMIENNLGVIIFLLIKWRNFDKKEEEAQGVLILDILNIFNTIGRMFFGENTIKYRKEIYDVMFNIIKDYLSTYSSLKKILLCVQNHLLADGHFIGFAERLQEFMNLRNPEIIIPIFILPGHNRASADDVFGLVAYVIFTRRYPDFLLLLTGDGYKDFISKYIRKEGFKNVFIKYLNDNFHKINNLLGQTLIDQIQEEINFKERRGRRSTSTSPSHYPLRSNPYRRTSSGGTNKNKKSLLNKYTRKVKKLHKKRILSKKVVKNYKNYKNYKKKTLKRKHK